MIVTDSSAEISSGPFLWPPGTKAWRAVTLELAAPYAVVGLSQRQGPGWLHQTCIIWRGEDVINLCREVRRDRKRRITEIAILRPSSSKKDRRWHLERVHEVWTRVSAHGMSRTGFHGADGKVLWEVPCFEAPSEAEHLEFRIEDTKSNKTS